MGLREGRERGGRAYFRFQQFDFGGVGHRPLGSIEDRKLVTLKHFASVVSLPFSEAGADEEEGAEHEIGTEKHGVFRVRRTSR